MRPMVQLCALIVALMALLTAPAATMAQATPQASPTAASVVKLPPRFTAPEYRMGDHNAPVTVVEYASDTCPHCARFAAEVFPAFKAKYIDTGKVLYVFREFPTDPADLSVAGFLVARCAGEAKYFEVLNALFQVQSTARTGLDFLMAGAKVGGLSEDQVKACLNDPDAIKALNDRVQQAVDMEKIEGTPTFLIEGKKMVAGDKSLKDFDAVLQPLLAEKPAKTAKKRRAS